MSTLRYYYARAAAWVVLTWNELRTALPWKALIWAMLIQLAFGLVVWGLLFGALLGITVPRFITFVVDMVVFFVVYIKLAKKFYTSRYLR